LNNEEFEKMKTFYKSIKILLAATLVCLVFDSCASSYASDGRYRPRRSKSCKCAAYSYNEIQKNLTFFAFVEQKKQ
jgi:hypothetical protein